MSTTGLTRRQADVYKFICDYFAEHGTAPTYAEIKEACAFKSATQAHEAVHAIEVRGLIQILPRRARGIVLKDSRDSLTIPHLHPELIAALDDYTKKTHAPDRATAAAGLLRDALGVA